ncbi:hypothetical protein [Asaia krungthepensis]|uniref:Uncharacterized protein n=1 Tax=Asaia krungthepensis NRIC 0535 TaxID=1307925 RepID=A0ABQ0Q726_9PROT|nr:hypothetical protein [Asaia krungthepensis]GBQ94127.1 hypothetical protein AA0535_3057 [Asaia krungthepensis NRIC 0535]
MIVDILCFLGGAGLCLGLLLAIRPILASFFPLMLQLCASGAFMGGIWAHHASAVRWEYGSWMIAGFLIAPLSLLPVVLRLSGERVAGAARAAAGLGASPSARLRYLWAPLLRLPFVVSCAVLAVGIVACLFTPPHAHV